MNLSEKVLIKLQSVLGDKYQLSLGNAFARKYTNPVSGEVEMQAFESLGDKVPAVLTMVPAFYNLAPFLSYNTDFELQFWCPIDNLKYDKDGILLEEPAVNIYSDLENLRTTLTGNVTIEDGLYAVIVFSEPVVGTASDKTGQYKRVVVTVRGKINLTDKGKLSGSTIIKLGIGTDPVVYYEIKGITQKRFSATTDGATVQEQGTTMAHADGATLANSVTFTYDDWDDPKNLAMVFLREVAKGKIVTDSAFSIPVQIYEDATQIASYNALLDVSIISQQGNTGIDTVEVTLQRAGV